MTFVAILIWCGLVFEIVIQYGFASARAARHAWLATGGRSYAGCSLFPACRNRKLLEFVTVGDCCFQRNKKGCDEGLRQQQ